MPSDEHVAMLGDGAAVWSKWRANLGETPDLSGAGLRGLDLSGFDLAQADLRGADLRGAKFCDADLSGARLDGANFFKAVLNGADLAGASLTEAQFLNCAQLVVSRNWQSASRDDTLACGASYPGCVQSRRLSPLGGVEKGVRSRLAKRALTFDCRRSS